MSPRTPSIPENRPAPPAEDPHAVVLSDAEIDPDQDEELMEDANEEEDT